MLEGTLWCQRSEKDDIVKLKSEGELVPLKDLTNFNPQVVLLGYCIFGSYLSKPTLWSRNPKKLLAVVLKESYWSKSSLLKISHNPKTLLAVTLEESY